VCSCELLGQTVASYFRLLVFPPRNVLILKGVMSGTADLVPVRVSFSWGTSAFDECFCWEVDSSEEITKAFVAELCEEHSIPSISCADEIVSIVRKQVEVSSLAADVLFYHKLSSCHVHRPRCNRRLPRAGGLISPASKTFSLVLSADSS